MDYQALRLLGSVGLAKAARGEVDVASVSVPKLLGAEAETASIEQRAAGGRFRGADPSVVQSGRTRT